MTKPTQSNVPLQAIGVLAGALSAATPHVNVTYGNLAAKQLEAIQSAPMSASDHALFDAKLKAEVADLRGDIRLNTSGLADLKSRFDDLSKRMADVPTNIATLTERVSHLPTKDELGTKLRNYLAVAGVAVAIVNGLVSWGPKLFGH